MKVLFSNPPWWVGEEGEGVARCWRAGVRAGSRWPFTNRVQSQPNRYRFGDYLPYPFFMGYATTYAQANTDADVHFRDSIALREGYDPYYRHVELGHYHYIFMESATPSWEHDAAVIEQVHRVAPETRIVVTGPITATRSAEILARYPVHACIQGEYEKGSVRVLNGESGIIEHDLLTTEEMNAAPFPYYDATYARRYWDACPAGQQRPQAQVWSNRGCPFKCIFCLWPATMTGNDPDGTNPRKVRRYSPAYTEAFLSEIVGKYHYKSIYFDDDTFNLGDKHVLGICGVMRKIGVPWAAMCRADCISLDTWAEMKASGCFGVKIGFESGNQEVIDHIIHKNLNLEHARKAVLEIKRLGMSVHGTFTFGLPGETREQMRDTERFMRSLPLDTLQVSGAAAMEGTPLSLLNERKQLVTYKGAVVDDSYILESDGNRKLDQIMQNFQRESQAPSPAAPESGPGAQEIMQRICDVCTGWSGEVQWALFQYVFSKYRVRDILILGVYYGRDIAFMAAILEDLGVADYHITGVDRFSDSYCEGGPEEKRGLTCAEAGFGSAPRMESAQHNLETLGYHHKLTLIQSKGEDYLRNNTQEYDFIYIDTSHDYATTMETIRLAVPRLRDGGVIAGDDYSDAGTWGVKTAVDHAFTKVVGIEERVWLAHKEHYSELPVEGGIEPA